MCPISAESPKGKGKSTWFDFELYKKIIDILDTLDEIEDVQKIFTNCKLDIE